MSKPYGRMTATELREVTREFDQELPVGRNGLPGRPMITSERKSWIHVYRKIGRPKIGKGVKRVMISVESDLLKQSDHFAHRHHLNRSQMVSTGLRKLMAG